MVYQLTMVHLDRDKPVQWQQLYINPLTAPALLKQKFNKISPDDYLQWLAPSTSTQHQLTAISANPSQRLELALSVDEAAACLQLVRRCWHKQNVRSFSLSLYPASAYSLGDNLLDLDARL
jgi:GntR family histidine utilization transcriptional repressor